MTTRPYLPCRQIITFLGDYLDRTLTADMNEEFERHLAVCASCRAYLASYRETIRLARSAEDDAAIDDREVPDELIVAILAASHRK